MKDIEGITHNSTHFQRMEAKFHGRLAARLSLVAKT